VTGRRARAVGAARSANARPRIETSVIADVCVTAKPRYGCAGGCSAPRSATASPSGSESIRTALSAGITSGADRGGELSSAECGSSDDEAVEEAGEEDRPMIAGRNVEREDKKKNKKKKPPPPHPTPDVPPPPPPCRLPLRRSQPTALIPPPPPPPTTARALPGACFLFFIVSLRRFTDRRGFLFARFFPLSAGSPRAPAFLFDRVGGRCDPTGAPRIRPVLGGDEPTGTDAKNAIQAASPVKGKRRSAAEHGVADA